MRSPEELKALFNTYLQNHQFDESHSQLYTPVNYIMNSNGKRFRPILVMMGYELFDDNVEDALSAALGYEVFHNFSLVHDDIMDAASLRRGCQTVHKKFGINQAILSGDVMMMIAYDLIMKKADEANWKNLLEMLIQTSIELCEGQHLDMAFEERVEVEMTEYIQMIRGKTAVLLGASLMSGALLAGATKKDAELLYDFGLKLGIAFQIQDDILDTYGEENVIGKKIGGDIIQRKKTFLYVKANDTLTGSSRKRLNELYTLDRDLTSLEMDEVIGFFDTAQVKQYASEVQEKYYTDAMADLDSIPIEENRKIGLQGLAVNLFMRNQ